MDKVENKVQEEKRERSKRHGRRSVPSHSRPIPTTPRLWPNTVPKEEVNLPRSPVFDYKFENTMSIRSLERCRVRSRVR